MKHATTWVLTVKYKTYLSEPKSLYTRDVSLNCAVIWKTWQEIMVNSKSHLVTILKNFRNDAIWVKISGLHIQNLYSKKKKKKNSSNCGIPQRKTKSTSLLVEKILPFFSSEKYRTLLYYRVWIHSETHTWHDKNIQSNRPYR